MGKFGAPKKEAVNLDIAFPEYRKISEAPSMGDLEDEALRSGVDVDFLVERERSLLYKSRDRYGNIFLIQNPAVWRDILVNGKLFKLRPTPKLAQTTEDKALVIVDKIVDRMNLF